MSGWDDDEMNINNNNTNISLLNSNKPKILLMGPRRSGKTSIQQVTFMGMSAHETLFLTSTPTVECHLIANNPLISFTIWDFSGDYSLDEDIMYDNTLISPEQICDNTHSIIFVMDAQEENMEQGLFQLVNIIRRVKDINTNIQIEVFLHKVDGDLYYSDEIKLEKQREIQDRVENELGYNIVDMISIAYHLTSIYDHSIVEALSRVVQKLIKELSILVDLLNILINTCEMEKAFLFDVISKIYIATDSGPVETQAIELCSDMIDVALDMSNIYSNNNNNNNNNISLDNNEEEIFPNDSSTCIRLNNGIILYLKQVSSFLALVCLIRSDNFKKKGIIDYNIDCFKEALWKIFTPNSNNI